MSAAYAFDRFDEEPFARVVCPDGSCGRPAVIEDRWTWPSTDGIVGMVKVRCEAGCSYTVQESDLEFA
jgi:hypothetical protein